ncbi:BON domain-containing protein [Cupriavidus basilensis]
MRHAKAESKREVPQVYKGRASLLNVSAPPQGRAVVVRFVYNRMLLATKGLRPNGIRVRTENGVVHLDGKVKNDFEKLTALNAVRAVDGVQSVVDGMQVGE